MILTINFEFWEVFCVYNNLFRIFCEESVQDTGIACWRFLVVLINFYTESIGILQFIKDNLDMLSKHRIQLLAWWTVYWFNFQYRKFAFVFVNSPWNENKSVHHVIDHGCSTRNGTVFKAGPWAPFPAPSQTGCPIKLPFTLPGPGRKVETTPN